MRPYAILLFFAVSNAACLPTLSTSLANSSLNLSQADCIYITDLNTTIYATSYIRNDAMNITAPQTIINPITNTVYQALYDKLNVNQTLDYGQIYYDPAHNITINAPKFPKINEIVNMTAGTTKTYPNYNLTITSSPKVNNILQNLDYGQCYTDAETVTKICAPTKPPILNDIIKLNCGQKKDYFDYGISISGPDCLGAPRTLNPGERINNPALGIDLTAPIVNKEVSLKANESFSIAEQKLSISCSPTAEQYINYCKNMNDTAVVSNWQTINVSTCTSFGYVCLDGISKYCKPEEKYGNRDGMLSCFNRNLDEMQTTCASTKDQLNICTTEKDKNDKAIQNVKDINDANTMLVLVVVIGLGIFTLSAILIYRLLLTKKQEKGVDQ